MQTFGDFQLDLEEECLWRCGERIPLTPRPFAVLRYLVENPGRVVTHDELLEALWPETYVQPQVLRTYVLDLRKLLGDDPAVPQYIETIPKRGYRFLAPVRHDRSDSIPCEVLIGREKELAALQTRLERAQKGERPTLFLLGEAGIGKTALIDAFCDALRESGSGRRQGQGMIHIARGQSIEGFGGKEAFYPVREAVNSLCDEEKARAVLAAALPCWFARNGATGQPTLGEICESLEWLSQNEALLVIFEDIHWADTSTLDLIAALARRRTRARLMLLVSFRPEEVDAQHPLRRLHEDLITSRRSEELRLGPLGKEAVREYLKRELRSEKLPVGLTSLVHQHSIGNPLFMTAVLDHLCAQKVVCSEDGEAMLKKPLEEIELGVPDGLSGMIEMQLERLSNEDRRLLEAGSVAGTIFPVWAAAAALDCSLEDAEETYATLARRVRLFSIAGHDELPDGVRSSFYVFSHALYREVLYNRIPAARRSLWHRRVADRLRVFFAGREEQVAEEIAAHAAAAK